MPGIFSIAAGAASAIHEGERADRLDAERRRRMAQEEEDRAQAKRDQELSRAATLASLRNAGIVPNSEQEPVSIDLPGVGYMGKGLMKEHRAPTEAVKTDLPDTKRYKALGTTGFVQDERKTPGYLAERAAERQATDLRRRAAAVRARNPQYKDMNDDQLRAVVEDEPSYREALKGPKGPSLSHANVINPTSGMVEDVFEDGSRKVVRRATKAELEKESRIPRDPNAPAPPPAQRPLDAMAAKEKAADDLAYSAMEAANGNIAEALGSLNRPGEHEKAVAAGVTFRHLQSAKRRYDDRLTSKSKVDAPVDIRAKYNLGASGPGKTANAPGTPPAPKLDERATETSESFTREQLQGAQMEVDEIRRRIAQPGGPTLAQALASMKVTPAAKAVLRGQKPTGP